MSRQVGAKVSIAGGKSSDMQRELSATSLPVLSWVAKIQNYRRENGIARDITLYDDWPTLRLGYTDVILMTSSDAYIVHPRPRPYFHIVSDEELKELCPDLFQIVYNTYPDLTSDWLPYITDDLRQRDFILNPGPSGQSSIADLASTVRIFALVNTG